MASDSAKSDQFPVGMKVLVVDDDPLCLMILERMLRRCQYTGEILFFECSQEDLLCLHKYLRNLLLRGYRCLTVLPPEHERKMLHN